MAWIGHGPSIRMLICKGSISARGICKAACVRFMIRILTSPSETTYTSNFAARRRNVDKLMSGNGSSLGSASAGGSTNGCLYLTFASLLLEDLIAGVASEPISFRIAL